MSKIKTFNEIYAKTYCTSMSLDVFYHEVRKQILTHLKKLIKSKNELDRRLKKYRREKIKIKQRKILHSKVIKKGAEIKFLIGFFDVKLEELRNMGYYDVNPYTHDYTKVLYQELKLSKKVEKRAREIIIRAKKEKIINKEKPEGISGGAIYIASKEFDEYRTLKQIAKIVNVSHATIYNIKEKMIKGLNIEIYK